MEWIIVAVIFAVLAKRGLKAQNKQVNIKEAASTIAANIVLEAAELCEIDVVDTSKSNTSKKS